MKYELWDYQTGNRCGVFNSLHSALKSIYADIKEYGITSDEITTLFLYEIDFFGTKKLYPEDYSLNYTHSLTSLAISEMEGFEE